MQHPNIVCFSIPNGGKRNKIEASILKQEGVLAGVADLFIMCPNENFHGLFLELKTEKGRQTKFQKDFQIDAQINGYKYVICRSLDEFIKEVTNYLIGYEID